MAAAGCTFPFGVPFVFVYPSSLSVVGLFGSSVLTGLPAGRFISGCLAALVS